MLNLRSVTTSKRKDEIAYLEGDYYTTLCQQRANLRMHLIRKIKGLERLHKDEEMHSVDVEGWMIPEDEDIIDKWLTEEDKNLLRYYHYILHDIDDTLAGTLDSNTTKKIMAKISPEWQERHGEYLEQLTEEIKCDYVTSMKKSIVDFILQEPFEEADTICAPVSTACTIIHDINAS